MGVCGSMPFSANNAYSMTLYKAWPVPVRECIKAKISG